MRRAIDSYTRQPIVEESSNKSIPNIHRGRSLYAHWRSDNKDSIEYAAHKTEDGWLIHRNGEWLPFLGPYTGDNEPRDLLGWLIQNDASLMIAIGWVKRGIPEPLFHFVEKANEIAN